MDETFSERHKLGDDFEVIPIPGHTGGATAFLWDSGKHRVLFTGDTVFLAGAVGGPRCSKGSATGRDTSRAWS